MRGRVAADRFHQCVQPLFQEESVHHLLSVGVDVDGMAEALELLNPREQVSQVRHGRACKRRGDRPRPRLQLLGKRQPQLGGLAIADVQADARASVALLPFALREAPLRCTEGEDEMLAGAEGVRLEVGAGAVRLAPLPSSERDPLRRTRDRAREQRGTVDAIERLLREPDGVAEFLGEIVGGHIAEFARKSPKLMGDTRAKLLDGIAAARKAPQPKPTQYWAISDRYSGIEHAQLVVVNVRHDSERGAGEQLAADLLRLRKEEKLFNDVLGFRGSRTPITAVVANLAQPARSGAEKGARTSSARVPVKS